MRYQSLSRYLLAFTVSLAGCSMMEDRFGTSLPTSRALSVGADALKAATLSDQDTIDMARKVAAEMDRNSQIADSKSPYAKRLAKLTSGLSQEDGLKLNYKVYIDPEVNAFSLADGTVRVYSGLMDRMNDEQILFVIGHEIGHVKNGHAKVRLQRAYAASAAAGAAGSYVQSATGPGLGGVAAAVGGEMLAELAAEVITAQFSQSDEMESDDYGVYFLARHGHRPEAALDALKTIDSESSSEGKDMMAQFTSTHPGGKERIENVALVISSLGNPAAQGATRLAANSSDETKGEAGWAKPEASVKPGKLDQKRPVPVEAVALKAPAQQPKLPAGAAETTAAGWYIQLAAFPDPAPAESMQGALRDRSERVTVQSTVVKGSQYERVLVGPYPTRKNAAVELERVMNHGIFEGEPFIRRLPN